MAKVPSQFLDFDTPSAHTASLTVQLLAESAPISRSSRRAAPACPLRPLRQRNHAQPHRATAISQYLRPSGFFPRSAAREHMRSLLRLESLEMQLLGAAPRPSSRLVR